jgi:ATP-dependent RNA helicase DeaD
VAARGLDLPALDLVIHAELPQNKSALLHRSGRTGRAGRKGVSILIVPYTKQRKAEALLASAKIAAVWSGPPMAEAVREKDQQRLLEGPLLQDAPTDEDLALGRKLLAGSHPEVVAAALVRLYRSQLPEPEEVFDDGRTGEPRRPARREERGEREGWRPERADRPDRSDRGERPPREPRSSEGSLGGAWFRLPVGRADKADPKWLIPLICRRGHVTKKDIGEIRIFPSETRFEIAPDAEARFREALARGAEARKGAGGKGSDGDVVIEPAGEPGPRHAGPPRGPKHGRGTPAHHNRKPRAG